MRAILPGFAVLLLAANAHAEGTLPELENPTSTKTSTAAPAAPPLRRFAIALNAPFSWIEGRAIAASVYAGINENVAIRANVASYAAGPPMIGDVFALASGDDGDEAEHDGRVLDLGVGVVHYSRGLWDGFTFEAGALRRARDTSVSDSFATAYKTSTDTTTYAGRVMIGWSWLIDKRAFIALAIGGSLGVETGDETTEDERGQMRKVQGVDRVDAAFESYLRLGAAF